MSESLEITGGPGEGRLTLFRLAGTLDATGAARLDEQARGIAAEGRHLVLNMEAVSFVSSTGIGVLLALNEDFSERGLDLRVSAPSKAVLAPIELLCLGRFIRTYLSDALACSDLAA
jgi:stage II sporulation protein AA (anti-sigma F factor antagonist)